MTTSKYQVIRACVIPYSRLLLELDLPEGKTKIEISYFPVTRERLSIHLPPTLVNLSAWNVLQVVIISQQRVGATSLNNGCKDIFCVYF